MGTCIRKEEQVVRKQLGKRQAQRLRREGNPGFATMRDCRFKLLKLGKAVFGLFGQI